MKSIDEIANEATRLVERVISNEVPAETCPANKEKAEWKKGQVREKVVEKLKTTIAVPGPEMLK